jgi:hypothetical protein
VLKHVGVERRSTEATNANLHLSRVVAPATIVHARYADDFIGQS